MVSYIYGDTEKTKMVNRMRQILCVRGGKCVFIQCDLETNELDAYTLFL